jgi:hypothetical protein
MSPSIKEYILLALVTALGLFLALAIMGSLTGCAHQDHHAAPIPSLSAAQNDASLIDAKSVVVQQWLRQN